MEHSESWMATKKVGTSRRRRRQERGTGIQYDGRGKGVWTLEARGEGGSRLSLVIRDVQEVYQPASTVWHRTATVPQSHNPAAATTVRQWLRHDNFNFGRPSCRGGKVWAHVCREQGLNKRDRNGVGRWGGVGVGEVGTRERHRGWAGGTYPDTNPTTSPNQLDWRLVACTDWTDDFDFNLSG